MANSSAANPFDDSALANGYEGWYAGKGRRADTLEKALLGKLLRTCRNAHRVLEVGCDEGGCSIGISGYERSPF